ncbi:MAG TPA: glycosyltransferase family A protein [Candidatus Acidoferrales bacterium]|nr:glycosyltransferase family A protein [Candidatus Acidoferrales bacterium]
MSRQPTVSVLMTAFNREKYIGAAIESVLAQSIDDFELLIVDDRSRDGTVDIAADYARRDRRIRVVVNESNLGDYPNRNRAARQARGRFLKYHDSDDLMYPHCLATMVAPLAAEPRAGFALTNGTWWPGGPCPMLLTPRMCYQREFLGHGLFMCGPAGALFRTEVFHALGGFPETGVGSDYLLWLSGCAQFSVLLVPADLFWYRVHGTQEYNSARATWEYAMVPGEAWRALASPTCPLNLAERAQARRNLLYSVVKLTYRDLRAGRWPVARHRLRRLGLSAADWLRYLRRPRRDAFAGTPRDAAGELVIPDWSHYQIAQIAAPPAAEAPAPCRTAVSE